MSTSTKRTISPDKLEWARIFLMAALGLIHLLEAPDELGGAARLRPLFFANFGGAIVATIGIYRIYRWDWFLGAVLVGGSFAGHNTAAPSARPSSAHTLAPRLR